jgi:hypothetical protein
MEFSPSIPRYYATLRLPLPFPLGSHHAPLRYLHLCSSFVSCPPLWRAARYVTYTGHISPGLLVYRYTFSSGSLFMKETRGPPEVPGYPFRHMPRTLIPAVTLSLAITQQGLLSSIRSSNVDFHRLAGYPNGPQLYIFRDSITRPASLFPLCFGHLLSKIALRFNYRPGG